MTRNEKIIAAYCSGLTMRDCGEMFGLTAMGIYKVLQKYGVETRKAGRRPGKVTAPPRRSSRPRKASTTCDATGLSAREAAIQFHQTHTAKQIADSLGVSRNVVIGHWFRARKSGELASHD